MEGKEDGVGGADEGEGDEGGNGNTEDRVGEVEGAVGGQLGVFLELGHLLVLGGETLMVRDFMLADKRGRDGRNFDG